MSDLLFTNNLWHIIATSSISISIVNFYPNEYNNFMIQKNKRKFSFFSSLKKYDHIFLKILPPLGAFILKLISLSYRIVEEHGKQEAMETLKNSGNSGVFLIWHQRMFPMFYACQKMDTDFSVIVSASRDGRYAGELAKYFGFSIIWVSSSSKGAEALREAVDVLKSGKSLGITFDGPQGPPRKGKPGAILAACKTGCPVIPLAYGVDRCWIINSWDRYIIPKPFSKIVLKFGKPVFISDNLSEESVKSHSNLLENRLNEETTWCDLYFGEERPWKKEKKSV